MGMELEDCVMKSGYDSVYFYAKKEAKESREDFWLGHLKSNVKSYTGLQYFSLATSLGSAYSLIKFDVPIDIWGLQIACVAVGMGALSEHCRRKKNKAKKEFAEFEQQLAEL